MSCRCFSMRSLSPARWAYRRRAPMNFCMRTVSHRFGSAAGLSYRRNSSVSGWSDRREAHMKNKYLPARVSRVWRLCPIFRAQPGACPPEAQNRTLRRRAGALAENARIGKNGSGESRLRQTWEHAETGKIEGFWTPRRESRINGWRRNRRFSCSQQPAVRTVSRGCAGAAIGACLEKNKRGWRQKSRKRRRFKGFRRAAPQIGGL